MLPQNSVRQTISQTHKSNNSVGQNPVNKAIVSSNSGSSLEFEFLFLYNFVATVGNAFECVNLQTKGLAEYKMLELCEW